MEIKFKVPVSRAQELIKDIRVLAASGRTTFTRHLYDPLDHAGWQSDAQGISARKMMERLNHESMDESYLHTIGPRCKRLISAAMSESLSALGDSSIFFLEKMQLHVKISASPEAIDFAEILSSPLGEFRKKLGQKTESAFREEIGRLKTEELISVIEPVKLETNADKVRIGAEIRRLYDNILIASKYNNLPKCRKILSSYIMRFCDDPEYAQNDVTKLITALNKREAGFDTEMNTTIAIELYYQITRAVLGGDIRSAIQWIRKYGYIFGGDTESKHFYDIDRLERILYQMITDKGLWDELKSH